MATKYTLVVPTRSITFGVPLLDAAGEPLDPIVYENVTVTPHAAAWVPDRKVSELAAKGLAVLYDRTAHSYLPIPAEPVDAA